MLAKNCGIKGGFKGLRKLIKDHDGRELWMSPEAALEFGIVDKIGTPQIVRHVTYELQNIKGLSRTKKIERAQAILGVGEERKLI